MTHGIAPARVRRLVLHLRQHFERAVGVVQAWPLRYSLPALSVCIVIAHQLTTGFIEAGGGLGYDGVGYGRMLAEGLFAVPGNHALRPLVVLLTRPAYWITGNALTAFVAMNFVWTPLLALGLVRLGEHYHARASSISFGVVVLLLTISFGRMPAFYPALVDLGTVTIMTWALYLAVVGSRWRWVAAIAAVVSREFGLAVVVFNVITDVRRRRLHLPAVAAVAAVPLIAFGLLRALQAGGSPTIRFLDLVANLRLWLDPLFVMFFAYFALTVFGGVSAVVAVTVPRWVRFVGREWEWLGYAVFVVAAAAAGSWDISRYLAFLAPAVFVLMLAGVETIPEGKRLALFGVGFVLTVVTQRPFQSMTLDRYFAEWFPYYALRGNTPNPLQVWPFWIWQMILVVVGLVTLVVVVTHSQGMTAQPGSVEEAAITRRTRRRVWVLVVGSVFILLLIAVVGVQDDNYAPRINVRWVDGISAADRAAAEQRFGLVAGVYREQNTWGYDLINTSSENVSAILADTRIADTHHIDRASKSVSPDAPRGRTMVASSSLAALKRSLPLGSLGRLFGSLALVAAAWLAMTSGSHGAAPGLE